MDVWDYQQRGPVPITTSRQVVPAELSAVAARSQTDVERDRCATPTAASATPAGSARRRPGPRAVHRVLHDRARPTTGRASGRVPDPNGNANGARAAIDAEGADPRLERQAAVRGSTACSAATMTGSGSGTSRRPRARSGSTSTVRRVALRSQRPVPGLPAHPIIRRPDAAAGRAVLSGLRAAALAVPANWRTRSSRRAARGWPICTACQYCAAGARSRGEREALWPAPSDHAVVGHRAWPRPSARTTAAASRRCRRTACRRTAVGAGAP